MKLAGKVAIVTGASRGIGKAEAIAMAKEGAAVIVAARTIEVKDKRLPGTIFETVDQIKSDGGRAMALKCDVSKEEDVQAMVQSTLETFGRVDILINNAAVAFPLSLLEISLKRWQLVMDVNMTGTFLCTRAVAPAMIKQGSGSIINTSSDPFLMRTGSPAGITYGVAKAAIEQFTYTAAAELASYNIAVNCLAPGKGVLTEGSMIGMSPDFDKSDWIGPENMVKAALFLAVQDAKGVTATVAKDMDYIVYHNL